ncbi:MAG: ATP-dependent DNA helicase RecG [Clostridia bacterium]|nr:ATP-dependent DNA helicase RecG [Clostridia bacterium]
MTVDMNADIRRLSGVGSTVGAKLGKLGITTVGSLLYHFPRAYEFRGNIKTVASAEDKETAAFVLTVAAPPSSVRTRSGKMMFRMPAGDGTGGCTITFFNQSYIKYTFAVGASYRFYGKVSRRGKHVELTSPVYEPYSESLLPLYPVYPATEGLTSAKINKLISSLVDREDTVLPENLPEEIIEAEHLMSRTEAVRAIHHPATLEAVNDAKRRLAFEEIFGFALKARQRKKDNDVLARAPFAGCDCSPFRGALGFEPTDAQKRVMNEIYADLTGKKNRAPMRRMVSGDVGSGKTVCAQFAAWVASENGYQTALMVPTEILARQHYADTKELFGKLGKSVRLLISDLPAKEKKEACDAIASGECDIVIGTHALLTDKVEFKKLGLVICDEQHRFGVNQREALLRKGEGAHMLVMSATPIPRTLALVLFGDLDVSVIDEMPPGRRAVRTAYRDESSRDKVYSFIKDQVKLGRQAYIVCPGIEETEDDGLIPLEALSEGFSAENYGMQVKRRKAAVNYANTLSTDVFPELRVGYLHGKMKGAEKSAVMRSFERGELDVLVSTTVIEVGINVPNASVMLVEDADCFGLSQLHQLRGRVGRGRYASYCILMANDPGHNAEARLKLMERENNGYKIAEFDLKQRGPGDFIRENDEKIRQHGAVKLRMAGALNDAQLLYRAFEWAEKYCLEG